MPNVNRVTLIGHIGRDPELRHTGSGTAVANTTLAVNHKYKDKQEVYWARLVFWDRKAELLCEYTKKGDPLYVEGRLTERTWEKDGEEQRVTEIVVLDMQFLGGKHDSKLRERVPQETNRDRAPASDFDDDIPF